MSYINISNPTNNQVNALPNSQMDVQHNHIQMFAPQYNQQMNAKVQSYNPQTYEEPQNIQMSIQQTDENIFQQKLRKY